MSFIYCQGTYAECKNRVLINRHNVESIHCAILKNDSPDGLLVGVTVSLNSGDHWSFRMNAKGDAIQLICDMIGCLYEQAEYMVNNAVTYDMTENDKTFCRKH